MSDPTKDPSLRAKELYRKLWAPLEQHIRDATHIYLSPDGPLNLIPFGALPIPCMASCSAGIHSRTCRAAGT